MWIWFKRHKWEIVLLFLLSLIFTFDLLASSGEPATFDSRTHITQMQLFYRGLLDGDFPVAWGDGFANYGMPIPIIAQQLPNYIGTVVNFFTNDILLSYKILILLITFLSGLGFYWLLGFYINQVSVVMVTFVYMFAPYKILNVYIRGALPEYMTAVFIPLIWMGIEYIFNKRLWQGSLLLSLGLTCVILTHPMMLVVFSLPLGCLLAIRLYKFFNLKNLLSIVASSFFALGLSAYYILPLMLEIKFFYYGSDHHGLRDGHFLNWQNFLLERWEYFGHGDVFVRANFIDLGLIELIILLMGIIVGFIFVKRRFKNMLLFLSLVCVSVIYVILMLPVSGFLYKIPLLGAIQYPWRMMGGLTFVLPIILAFLLGLFKNKKISYLVIVILSLMVVILRFPQLYGKNYIEFGAPYYAKTLENLHGDVLNTIWTGKTHTYPIKDKKAEIIEGEGELKIVKMKNSLREYRVNSKNGLRMVDYTFYFPGWRVFIDGLEAEIQFQDPAYRGVITYLVPAGEHSIKVQFTDTKIRFLGKLISAISLLIGTIAFAKLRQSCLRKCA